MFVRISATDWVEGAWDVTQSVEFAKLLKGEGIDLVDVSSAANVPKAEIPVGPGYQVALAERTRREAGIATGAVGMISEPCRRTQLFAPGKRIWCCWRGNCCAIRIGRCGRRRS